MGCELSDHCADNHVNSISYHVSLKTYIIYMIGIDKIQKIFSLGKAKVQKFPFLLLITLFLLRAVTEIIQFITLQIQYKFLNVTMFILKSGGTLIRGDTCSFFFNNL